MKVTAPGVTTAPGVAVVTVELPPVSVSSNTTASPLRKLVAVTPLVQFTVVVSHTPFTYPFQTSFVPVKPLPVTCNTRLFAFNASDALALPLTSAKFAVPALTFVNVMSG